MQVTQLLSRFGLRQRAKTTVSALSGGEQQRVALCRALLMRPAVVFADEPTGALDTANSELVLQVLRELADAGSSVVMVTHDTDAAALADHVIFLRDGQVTHIAGRLTAEQIADKLQDFGVLVLGKPFTAVAAAGCAGAVCRPDDGERPAYPIRPTGPTGPARGVSAAAEGGSSWLGMCCVCSVTMSRDGYPRFWWSRW